MSTYTHAHTYSYSTCLVLYLYNAHVCLRQKKLWPRGKEREREREKLHRRVFLRDRWRQIRAKQETPRVCLALSEPRTNSVAAAVFDDRQDTTTTTTTRRRDSKRYRKIHTHTHIPTSYDIMFLCVYTVYNTTCTRGPPSLIYYRVRISETKNGHERYTRTGLPSNPLRLTDHTCVCVQKKREMVKTIFYMHCCCCCCRCTGPAAVDRRRRFLRFLSTRRYTMTDHKIYKSTGYARYSVSFIGTPKYILFLMLFCTEFWTYGTTIFLKKKVFNRCACAFMRLKVVSKSRWYLCMMWSRLISSPFNRVVFVNSQILKYLLRQMALSEKKIFISS